MLHLNRIELEGSEELSSERALAMFKDAERRAAMPEGSKEDYSERLTLCWRLARRMAVIRGAIAPGDLLPLEPEQVTPLLLRPLPGPLKVVRTFLAKPVQEVILNPTPLAVLPDLATSEEVGRFQTAYLAIAVDMGLFAGTPENPYFGSRFLRRAQESALEFRTAFPGVMALLEFESKMLTMIGRQLADKAALRVQNWLQRAYGMGSSEALDTMKAARTVVAQSPGSSIEERRGMMVLRIERYLERARKAMDLKSEMAGLRLLSKVEGLDSSTEESPEKAILSLFSRNQLQLPEASRDTRSLTDDDAAGAKDPDE